MTIFVSSTTGSAEDVQRTLDHDEATGYNESSRSPGHIIVSSTTGTPEESAQAAGMYGDEVVATGEEAAKEIEGFVSPIAHSTDKSVWAAVRDGEQIEAVQQQCEEVSADLEASHEEAAARYLGKPSTHKRIQQLLADRLEARNEAEQLRQELQQYRGTAQQQGSQSENEQQASKGNGAQPQLSQDQLQQQFQQFQLQQLRAEATLPFRYREAAARHPDLAETFNRDDVQLPFPVLDALRAADDGFEVAYHIGKHPELAKEITTAYQTGDITRAGSLLDHVSNGLRFAAQNQPQQPSPQPARRHEPRPSASSTPAPITPLRGTSTASASKSIYDPSLDYQEYKRLMNEQERRR